MHRKALAFGLVAAAAFALGLLAADAQESFTLQTEDLAWEPVDVAGLPAGIEARALHLNPRTQMSSSLIRYPQGFEEPRHYHETCGHYIYVLEGRIESPDGPLTPGMFTYAAPKEAHGPYRVVEPSQVLFYTDGPFDFLVGEPR